uniref:Uncharacterized protein n=1 Tax=Nicotiana tabacum TaxID=4097 RepID=A0A1S4B735_TOBAC|nr:PREDICTED: uncharacterized protein LOC107805178 [Nicotiana tabacum]
MTGIKIYVGKIIFQKIGIIANQKQTSLLFPCLITTLCQAAKVHVLPGHNKMENDTKDIDIMRISDAVAKETATQPETLIPPPADTAVSEGPGLPDTSQALATSIATPQPSAAQSQVPLPVSHLLLSYTLQRA